MKSSKTWLGVLALAGCVGLPVAAVAQGTGGAASGSRYSSDAEWEAGRAQSYSLLPWTSYGYVGVNLGVGNWGTPCAGPYTCDDNAFAGKVYTGGLFSRLIGLEVGYINFGQPDRAGGSWRAQGANASVVLNLPLDAFNLFGRAGATYGWTQSDAALGSGLPSGSDDGWGISYGAGFGFDLTRNWAVTAEWDRQRFNFVTGSDYLDLYSLGVRYKF